MNSSEPVYDYYKNGTKRLGLQLVKLDIIKSTERKFHYHLLKCLIVLLSIMYFDIGTSVLMFSNLTDYIIIKLRVPFFVDSVDYWKLQVCAHQRVSNCSPG